MKALIVGVCLFLTACAGMAPVRNVDDALAYAKGQATSALTACNDAAVHKEITKEQLRVCIDSADKAAKIIDTGRTAGTVVEKESALLTALNILKIAQDLTRK